MHRQAVSRPGGDASGAGGDPVAVNQPTLTAEGERQSVGELVRAYGEPPSDGHKRDRSESGDPAPAGKRNARERSGEPTRSPLALSSGGSSRNFKDQLDAAVEDLEHRVSESLSRDLQEFRERMTAEIDKLFGRVKDLEQHVEERDIVIDRLTDELRHSREEVSALQIRIEDAEMNSRLPCLVLSGAAMSPRSAPRLGPPLSARPPGAGQGPTVTSQLADHRAGGGQEPAQSAAEAGGDRRGARGAIAARGGGGGLEEREDVNALVISTLNRCLPGLDMVEADVDRAHRLPGANNRVIVRFVRSGQDSVRDRVMSRRLELRGKELYINESLTKLRGIIFRSLLAAKRENKLYTVYSRGGQVYFKEKQHGVSTRVDSLRRLRELGYTPLDR